MVDQLVEKLKAQKIDKNYVHLFGQFDQSTCQNSGQGTNPDQCCGEYPARYPFVSRDGVHQCCGSKLFNSDYNECCDDVEVTGFYSSVNSALIHSPVTW